MLGVAATLGDVLCGSFSEYEGGESLGRSKFKMKGDVKGERLLCRCCSAGNSVNSGRSSTERFRKLATKSCKVGEDG